MCTVFGGIFFFYICVFSCVVIFTYATTSVSILRPLSFVNWNWSHVRWEPRRHSVYGSTQVYTGVYVLSTYVTYHMRRRSLPAFWSKLHTCQVFFVCISNGFCRAMLRISAAIAGARCLSVHLSVTFVSCVKTNKDIFEIFSPSGSKAILVIFMSNGMVLIQRKPPNGGVECKGVWKNDDFRPISRSVWETVIVRWAHSARQFVRIEFSFYPYNI